MIIFGEALLNFGDQGSKACIDLLIQPKSVARCVDDGFRGARRFHQGDLSFIRLKIHLVLMKEFPQLFSCQRGHLFLLPYKPVIRGNLDHSASISRIKALLETERENFASPRVDSYVSRAPAIYPYVAEQIFC